MSTISSARIRTGLCAHCGADNGLHQYETEHCPMGGREETREGVPQRWLDTTFDDGGMAAFASGGAAIAGCMDDLASKLLARIKEHPAPPGADAQDEFFCLFEALRLMEQYGISSQCASYQGLKKLGAPHA